MARDKNATIQQHQPLRTPEGWNRQEKMLLVQLDEILDDIYRRFGRLKLSDMSEAMQNGITVIDETTGERVMISEVVRGIDIKIADAEDSIAEISATAERIETKITELGYGMVFMQPDEPENYSKGDIWIQTLAVGDWQSVLDKFESWQDVLDNVSTWQVVGGIPKMFVYDGQAWVEMYDAEIQTNVMTQIEQLRDLIALRATVDDLNLLTGQVTQHSSELAIMAQQISSTVTTVNAKPSHYVQLANPSLTNEIHLGDTWTKHDVHFKTWQTIKDHYNTWQEVKDSHDAWMDGLGDRSFTWDGTEWIETSDKATEIVNRTRITETDTKIALMAVQQAQFQGDLIDLEAQITITATQIRQYVANNYYGMQSGIDILAAGIEISAAKYLKIKTGGVFTTESGNFSIDAQGNATFKGGGVFSGSLSAATGTFAGNLSAAGGTFAGNLSAAGGTFNGALQAATGTFAGNLSAAGGTFAGNLSAAGGTFAGQLSAATGTFKGNLTAAGGSFKGELVAATGTFKGALQAATGTFAGDLSAAGGTFAGNLSASGGTFAGELVAATGSFKGSLSAATGTFAGNLSAAGGTFAGQLQAATGSFAGSLSAATGTFAGSLSAATGTFAGTLSAACVTSGTMSADRIKGGTLALGGSNNTDGVLTIKNASGTQIGSWDRNGINAIAGTIGGWTLASNRLRSGSSTGYVGLDSNTNNTYAIWAGNEDAASAPFRLKRDGTLTVTKLNILNEAGTQEETIDLRSYSMWKLYYHVIKQVNVSGGYVTSMVLSNGDTVNFNLASAVTLSGSWSSGRYSVVAYNAAGSVVATNQSQAVSIYPGETTIKSQLESSTHMSAVDIRSGGSAITDAVVIDGTGVYKQGWNAARNSQSVVGTVYTIIAHQGDWVKVQEVGTGYSRVDPA